MIAHVHPMVGRVDLGGSIVLHNRVPAGDMQSGSDRRIPAGDMDSGGDVRDAPETI